MKEINENTYLLNPITISMVGPRGVGKTSLLASMYSQLQEIGAGFATGDAFDDGRTQEKLEIAHGKLIKLAMGRSIRTDKSVGIPAGVEKDEYWFQAVTQVDAFYGRKVFVLPFHFVDFPGGWFTKAGPGRKAVKECLGSSLLSYLAVDAPAVMAEDDIHNEHNMPMSIQSLYEDSRGDLAGHAVILTLIRGEKFIHEGRQKELVEKTRKRYRGLARALKNADIQLVGTIIETVGGVHFRNFEEDQNTGYMVHEFINTGEGYKPKNCQVPLQLGLARSSILLNQYFDNEKWDGLAGGLAKLFGGNNEAYAARACEQITSGIFSSTELPDDSIFDF